MPSPRAGTVTPDVARVVREYKAGKVEFRNDDGGIVHAVVGKMSFDAQKITENIDSFLHHLASIKPSGVKGVYVRTHHHLRHDEPRHFGGRVANKVAISPEFRRDHRNSREFRYRCDRDSVMSKYVKGLIIEDVGRRLQGVNDALICNVIGLDSEKTVQLRKELRVQGNYAVGGEDGPGPPRGRRALRWPMRSESTEGSMAVVWGAEDFICLCKEMVAIYKKPEYEKMKAIGGVMDGERLTAEKVEEVSKWPNRVGQLSILLGQILSPGSSLLSQLTGPAERWPAKSSKSPKARRVRKPGRRRSEARSCRIAIR